MSHPLLPIILCGGSGTRLWPLSRETYPKQFLTLMEDRSMLQQTVTRLKGLATHIPQASVPVLVCNEQHRFLLASQLMQIGVERCPILLEPAGRNCRIPDDCIDSKRYPLFMARAVLKELIESLQSTQGVKPC